MMRQLRVELAKDASLRSFDAAEKTVPEVFSLIRQDPPMADLDEMIFLLHTTAEIEHSLLVQYLYAAYSLPDSGAPASWREVVLKIAKEEMGHLLSVQNMLLALAAPLNFEREDYPYRALYPFPFRLEPLSVGSLARYVLAE